MFSSLSHNSKMSNSGAKSNGDSITTANPPPYRGADYSSQPSITSRRSVSHPPSSSSHGRDRVHESRGMDAASLPPASDSVPFPRATPSSFSPTHQSAGSWQTFVWKQLIVSTIIYCAKVVKGAARLLEIPLSVALFMWLLLLLVAHISQTLRPALAPFCGIPGVRGTAFCQEFESAMQHGHTPLSVHYRRLMDIQTTTFDELLGQSVGGAGLVLEIKKAEMATADLVSLVRTSNLRSRDVLGDMLAEFVNDARRTGRGLQRLDARVVGAADRIIAMNEYALRMIKEAAVKRTVWGELVHRLSWNEPSAKEVEQVISTTFTHIVDVLCTEMKRLILEAEISLTELNNLEEGLVTLHTLISREDLSISAAKMEILAELWTALGGNRRTLFSMDNHLALLRSLGDERKRAQVHVVTALQALQAMSAEMEDLRERVAAPDLLAGQIPVEVCIMSIMSSVKKLKEGRLKVREQEQEVANRFLGPGVGLISH